MRDGNMIDPFALPRLHPIANPPPPQRDWALFLDLDGTLLDIASRPDRVFIPRSLTRDLLSASAALGGALAIVTGRTFSDLDHLLSPLKLPGGSEHGAVVRQASGEFNALSNHVPEEWQQALVALSTQIRGVHIEQKLQSVAVHFRQARAHAERILDFCNGLVAGSTTFEVLRGKMNVEVRAREANKGRAVRLLMHEPPFLGRKPIFVGDDVTDQDGFRAAVAFGGDGLDVVTHFAGLPSEVRHWLKSIAQVRA